MAGQSFSNLIWAAIWAARKSLTTATEQIHEVEALACKMGIDVIAGDGVAWADGQLRDLETVLSELGFEPDTGTLPRRFVWCYKDGGRTLHIREKEGIGVSLCGAIRRSDIVLDREALGVPVCQRCLAHLGKLSDAHSTERPVAGRPILE